jgi:hypothetical protein
MNSGYRGETIFDLVRRNDGGGIQDLLDSCTSLSVDARDDGGWTALHHAARWNRPNIVSLLLDRGADPNLVTREGKSATFIASELGHHRVLAELRCWQTRMGRGGIPIEDLLDLSGEKEMQYNWTPLHVACYNGHASCVECLLRLGAGKYINEKDGYDRTPLDLLIERRTDPVLTVWLISKGAQTSADLTLPPLWESVMWKSVALDQPRLLMAPSAFQPKRRQQQDDICYVFPKEGPHVALYARKAVLLQRARGVLFAPAFIKNENTGTDIEQVEVTDTTSTVFEKVLGWICTKTLSTTQFDLILLIWQFSNRYGLSDLMHYCQKQLMLSLQQRLEKRNQDFLGQSAILDPSAMSSQNLTITDYLLSLFLSISRGLYNKDNNSNNESDEVEDNNNDSEVDECLKAIVGGCILHKLDSVLSVYDGDTVALVRDLFISVERVISPSSSMEFLEENSKLSADVKVWNQQQREMRRKKQVQQMIQRSQADVLRPHNRPHHSHPHPQPQPQPRPSSSSPNISSSTQEQKPQQQQRQRPGNALARQGSSILSRIAMWDGIIGSPIMPKLIRRQPVPVAPPTTAVTNSATASSGEESEIKTPMRSSPPMARIGQIESVASSSSSSSSSSPQALKEGGDADGNDEEETETEKTQREENLLTQIAAWTSSDASTSSSLSTSIVFPSVPTPSSPTPSSPSPEPQPKPNPKPELDLADFVFIN